MLCPQTNGLKKLQESWNFSNATGKQPRKELAMHMRPTRKEISPRLHRTERSKLLNRRQREKEASFRGTDGTLCRPTESQHGNESIIPPSASRRKKN